jgi:hypothetical protein
MCSLSSKYSEKRNTPALLVPVSESQSGPGRHHIAHPSSDSFHRPLDLNSLLVRLNTWKNTCFEWGRSVLTACHRFTGFLKLSSAQFWENQKCSSFLRFANVPGDRCSVLHESWYDLVTRGLSTGYKHPTHTKFG